MSQEIPLITTIIPTYRRPHLLKRAIKSVLNQNFKNLQVCVFDNASGDETREVVEAFMKVDERVKYYCHDENIGLLKNFKFGLDSVKTKYFSFLSDDDLLFPEFYKTAIKKLEEHSEVAFFAGNNIRLDHNNEIMSTGFSICKEALLSPNQAVSRFVGRSFPEWTSVVFNTQLVKSVRLETTMAINDIDYLYNIMFNNFIFVSPQICSVFFISPAGCSASLSGFDFLQVTDKTIPKLKMKNVVDSEIRNKAFDRINSNIKERLFKKTLYCLHDKDNIKEDENKEFLLKKFKAHSLLKRINFYKKLRKISLLWFFLYFSRLFIVRSKRFLLSRAVYSSQRSCILQILKSTND